MAEGKITTVKDGFFFIDKDYYCKSSNYSKEPIIGDIVKYDKVTSKDGRKSAANVSFIKNSFGAGGGSDRTSNNIIDEFLKELEDGYFQDNNLKTIFILEYPQKLAKYFAAQGENNKVAQVRKFFQQIRLSESKYKFSKDFNSIIPELYQLIPLLENAKNRKHITHEFQQYLTENIKEAAKSSLNFEKGFIPHFQALVAYYIKN